MNLFALKDKNTGEWLEGPPSETRITAYEDKAECEAVKDYFPEKEAVTVTLREEPTEPCEWCETFRGEMITPSYAFELTLDADDWHFCPNCGRRLGDE